MNKRVVEIGTNSQLSLSNEQLCIHRDGERIGTIPIDDLGVLILDNNQVSYTLQLLQTCCEHNVAVICCDNRHLPHAILMPLAGNTLHSRILAQQILTTEPTKKRVWQAIIAAKITEQAKTLERNGKASVALRRFAQNVHSGDPENIEGQAANRYWKLLFGPEFRRDQQAGGANALLNYGYAIVRATVARALVGTGLHPSLGIHHHNQYDALCLADDAMEPFRPIVDQLVYQLVECAPDLEVSKENKRALLSIFETKWRVKNAEQPFMVAVQLYAASLKDTLLANRKSVVLPESVFPVGT